LEIKIKNGMEEEYTLSIDLKRIIFWIPYTTYGNET